MNHSVASLRSRHWADPAKQMLLGHPYLASEAGGDIFAYSNTIEGAQIITVFCFPYRQSQTAAMRPGQTGWQR